MPRHTGSRKKDKYINTYTFKYTHTPTDFQYEYMLLQPVNSKVAKTPLIVSNHGTIIIFIISIIIVQKQTIIFI